MLQTVYSLYGLWNCSEMKYHNENVTLQQTFGTQMQITVKQMYSTIYTHAQGFEQEITPNCVRCWLSHFHTRYNATERLI